MDTSKSEFFHFVILPDVSIYSPLDDQYSEMYIPRDKCECGCNQWVAGQMDIIQPFNGYNFPKKYVHRCYACNEVRMSDHIGRKNDEEF